MREKTKADKIISACCNAARNSDLRADNPAVIAAINQALAAKDAKIAEWELAQEEINRQVVLARAEIAALREDRLECQQRAITWMKRHDALLGFIQKNPGMLKEYIEWARGAE